MATVVRAPDDMYGRIDVQWIIEEEVVTVADVRWARRGDALPEVGDDALLMIDTEAATWAMVW